MFFLQQKAAATTAVFIFTKMNNLKKTNNSTLVNTKIIHAENWLNYALHYACSYTNFTCTGI
jgi:sugar (pentulose or hexulose) kinase